jgi:hypothetical protein
VLNRWRIQNSDQTGVEIYVDADVDFESDAMRRGGVAYTVLEGAERGGGVEGSIEARGLNIEGGFSTNCIISSVSKKKVRRTNVVIKQV